MEDNKNYKIIELSNREIYNTFNANLYGAAKSFPNKIVRGIIIDLIEREVFLIGVGSNEYNDFGKGLFVKGGKISNIILNATKLNIDFTTGKMADPSTVMLYAYYLYLLMLVNNNLIKIKTDRNLTDGCIKYLNFLFFKILQLTSLPDKKKDLVRSINEVFFRKFILDYSTKESIMAIENQESKEYLLKYIDVIDRYQTFTNIFIAYMQLNILTEKQPMIYMREVLSTTGIVGFSLLVQQLSGFISSCIISQYEIKDFKGLLIDTKLQGSIEMAIQKFHDEQKFINTK